MAFIGCTEPNPHDELLVVNAVPDAIVLKNRTNDFVPTFVIEQRFAASANYTFCRVPVPDPAQTGAIPPHGSVTVPRSHINNYSRGAKAFVLHSRLVRDVQNGYFACDSIRSLVVTLR